MKTPDYLSYERYKRKKDSSSNKRISIFITTFIVTLLVFVAVVRSLSPDVDVSIGNDTEATPKENGLGVKRFIDERLKMIQMDDGSKTKKVDDLQASQSSQNSQYNNSSFNRYAQQEQVEDANVNSTLHKNPNKNGQLNGLSGDDTDATQYAAPTPQSAPPRPKKKDLTVAKPRSAKVYIGRYSTLEQAKVSQEILMDSGLGITPFIKDSGSYYTLQVGNYTSHSKAEGMASELQKNGFPARIVDN